MQADHVLRAAGEGGDGVEVERRGVGGEDRAGLAHRVETLEHLALDVEILEHRLDRHIDVAQRGVVGDPFEQGQATLHLGFAEAAALDAGGVGVAGALQGTVERGGVDLQQLHRHAGVGERQGDADAHGAAADHRGALDAAQRGVRGDAGDLGRLALGEEGMHQRRALRRGQTLLEQLALALEARGQRQGRGGFHRGDAAQRREQPGHALADFGVLGADQLGVGFRAARHLTLAGTPRALAVGQQLAGMGEAGVGEVTVEQRVDDAVLQCLAGADRRAADDHLQGLGHPGHARQPLGAAGTRQQAELHFRQADLGIAAGDAVMAGQRHFQATTEGGAVDHRDAGLGAGFKGGDHIRQRRRLRRQAELLDVGTGDEGVAGTHQHHGGDLRVGLGGAEGLQQALAHGQAEGVDRRVVHGDQGEIVAAFELHGG
ncbi:hypothetical protein D9M70_430180 [compost metagenome]